MMDQELPGEVAVSQAPSVGTAARATIAPTAMVLVVVIIVVVPRHNVSKMDDDRSNVDMGGRLPFADRTPILPVPGSDHAIQLG
ncbi:MAG: hypothetical protein VX815_12205, partial [Gemmatimonadota bacterium]|nr:hypothetical protein [Gemmatimonadota bacterium]